MAWARVISGGVGGRYVVELDYGDALRAASLAAATARLSQIDTQIAEAQVELSTAEAKEAQFRASIASVQTAIINAASLPNPGGTGVNTLPLVTLQRQLGALLALNQPIRDRIASLKFERSNWRRKAAMWTTLQTKVQKQAWCVDFTEDIPAGAYVATCDIPGDPNLVLISAGGRQWSPSDGEFRSRELLSPAQAYFNAAVFPAWQKFKPTYRWGTITAINFDTNRMTLALFDQRSSSQRLSVNQASTLTSIEVDYMDCDAVAFKVGDRAVVQFMGQNWTSPRVIGFVDNPKPCRKLSSLIAIPDATTLTQQLFQGQTINGATAPAAPYVYHPLPMGTLNAFIGWHIRWEKTGSSPLYEYVTTRVLPSLPWNYESRPFSTRLAEAQYFNAFNLNAISGQVLLERLVRSELIPDSDPPRYNKFVSGRYGVTVNIYKGDPPSTTDVEFTYYFEEVGEEVAVGEFTDPATVTPPNIVFTASGRYPSLSKLYDSTTPTFGMPYAVTIEWAPLTGSTWGPTSILPLEP